MRNAASIVAALLVLLVAFAAGCSGSGKKKEEEAKPLLHVGVAPDYAPLVFKRDGKVVGLEVDLGRLLAEELRADVVFDVYDRSQLIPKLQDKKVDILMSGITVTRAREVRVAFAKPYLGTALGILRRTDDVGRFDTIDAIRTTEATIGVVRGTVGETWVEHNCPTALKETVGTPEGAVFELKRNRIDVFVGDMYSVAWLAAENETDLAGLWEPFEIGEMAWAVHPTDLAFREEIDKILARWRTDGTLERVVRTWLPYYDRVREFAEIH